MLVNISVYLSFFLLATVKFMFTPFAGPAAKLSFFETYISCVSGAVFSAGVFDFMGERFMKRAHNKRVSLNKEALAKNEPLPGKKNFTKVNKIIVKTKKKLGIYGIALYAPFFLSVPIGSIIAAKFYGKNKKTFSLIVIGMLVNGLITTSISYFVVGRI